jgi:hypothetical protein
VKHRILPFQPQNHKGNHTTKHIQMAMVLLNTFALNAYSVFPS